MLYKDALESERLITRFVTQDDVALWTEYCSDPITTKYTALPDKTPAEMAKFVIDVTLKRYEDNRLGLQALIDKNTGEFVGQCGLLLQEDVNGISEVEIGYHLLRRHWRKGYAIEAARMFRDYGFKNNFANSIVSIIHPDNAPSKKVAVKNGMKIVDTASKFRGSEYNLFRITRTEWEALNGN